MPGQRQQENIKDRFRERAQAERYRDRFRRGRRRATHAREVEALDAILSDAAPVHAVLDVGCGPGRFVPAFLARVESVTLTDVNLSMLEVARDDHASSARRISCAVADAFRLPFADRGFDLVFCHRLLNHLPDERVRRAVVAELARVSSRFVVVSCLAPPRWLRQIRKSYERLARRESLDGHIDPATIQHDAEHTGLTLQRRTRIRRWQIDAEFFTYAVNPNTGRLAS